MYHNLELTVAQYFTLHTFGYDGLMAILVVLAILA